MNKNKIIKRKWTMNLGNTSLISGNPVVDGLPVDNAC